LHRHYETVKVDKSEDSMSQRSSFSQRENTFFKNESTLIYDVEIINPNPESLTNKEIFKMCSKAEVIKYAHSSDNGQDHDSTYRVQFRDKASSKASKIMSHLEKLGCKVDVKGMWKEEKLRPTTSRLSNDHRSNSV
jgi:hypothetical protein